MVINTGDKEDKIACPLLKALILLLFQRKVIKELFRLKSSI